MFMVTKWVRGQSQIGFSAKFQYDRVTLPTRRECAYTGRRSNQNAMKEKGPEKRRSDRLMITLPLVVEGKDSKGQSFDHKARTITINRHGARITTPHPLRAGQTITVTNLAAHKRARFRVVGPIAPATYRGGEWGIECADLNENIWGIQFPPAPADEKHPSKALLECRDCGTTALLRVSLVQVEGI